LRPPSLRCAPSQRGCGRRRGRTRCVGRSVYVCAFYAISHTMACHSRCMLAAGLCNAVSVSTPGLVILASACHANLNSSHKLLSLGRWHHSVRGIVSEY
jgi:hypothetical protein